MSRRFAVSIATLALLAAGSGPAAAQDFTHRIEMMSSLLGGSYLGVVIDDVGAESASELKLRQPRGAAVREVEQDSPAAAAGVLAGDVIVSFQAQRVESAAALTRMVRETPAGRNVSLGVRRAGAEPRIEVRLEARPARIPAGARDRDPRSALRGPAAVRRPAPLGRTPRPALRRRAAARC